jgi:4-amino-4-deoxy-L-arabinose transferase-like glycosyltransferase
VIESGTPSWAWTAASIVLLAAAVILTVNQPKQVIVGDALAYVEAADAVGEGRYQAASEPDGVPRYPPGFPIVLAPFVGGWGHDGARAASIVIGAALLGSVWFAARRVADDRAAALAALLWMASPMVRDHSTQVMSDPAGALFVMLAFLAALRGRWLLAGLALAWSSWIRLIHAAFLFGAGRRGASWLAAVLVLVPLAVFQLRTYGRLAGYDGDEAQFAVSNIFGGTPLVFMDRPSPWPNWQFFPGILWGLKSGLVPLLPLLAGFELAVRRAEPAARLAAWIIVSNVVVYLPYFYQTARFVLPAACLIIVFAAAGAVRIVDRFRDEHVHGGAAVGLTASPPAGR